jgi:hypothetical protein
LFAKQGRLRTSGSNFRIGRKYRLREEFRPKSNGK